MSRIDELIHELCPEGVAYAPLSDVVEINRGGGTPSRSRKGYWGGEIPWASVGDLNVEGIQIRDTRQRITQAGVENSSTNVISEGDVVVAVKIVPGKALIAGRDMAINQDLRGLTLKESIRSSFLVYFLQTVTVGGSGTIVKGISNKLLVKTRIPVPPLEVQDEIVRILDTFSALTAELEAELEARRTQYEYYRDRLVDVDNLATVRWRAISDLGTLYSGLSGKSKSDFAEGNARFLPYTAVHQSLRAPIAPNHFVRVASGERQNALQYGDVIFTSSSERADEAGLAAAVTSAPTEDVYLNSFCFGLRPHATEDLHPQFSKHLFRSSWMRRKISKTAHGVTRFNISKKRFLKIQVPVPGAEQQLHIASHLDQLYALVDEATPGLPVEIEARRKQYEYYRDLLLTFEEASA